MRARVIMVAATLALALAGAVPAGASHGWRTTLHFNWGGGHRFTETSLVLKGDGSFRTGDGARGHWAIDRADRSFVFRITSGCRPVYTAHMQGMSADGTMRCRRGHGKGSFYIDRLRPL